MEEAVLALVKLGVPALLGAFIDYGLMYKHQRQELRKFLAHVWLTASDLPWPSFGRKEVAAAIRIIDRLAGERLISKKRVRFVVVVGLTAIFASFVVGVDLTVSLGGNISSATFPQISWWRSFQIPFAMIALGLSVSLSQALNRTALLVPEKYSTLAFLGVLVAHFVLLLVWFPIVETIQVALALLASYAFDGIVPSASQVVGVLRMVKDVVALSDKYFLNCNDEGNNCLVWILNSLSPKLIALFANGLRLVISILFSVSFIAHRVVGNVVGKFWANLAESEWPIFTTLLGSLGAVWAAVYGVEKLIEEF